MARPVRLLALMLALYLIGLTAIMLGIAVFDSRPVIWAGLILVLATLAWARHAIRCPLCGASIFLTSVSAALPWVTGRTGRCPRCNADIGDATNEAGRGGTTRT